MTVAEFLAWEKRQEFRFEFDGFQPVAMTGGTLRTIASRSIGGDMLRMPEIEVEIPIDEFYCGLDYSPSAAVAGESAP